MSKRIQLFRLESNIAKTSCLIGTDNDIREYVDILSAENASLNCSLILVPGIYSSEHGGMALSLNDVFNTIGNMDCVPDMYLVEYGSRNAAGPWRTLCVCRTLDEAEECVDKSLIDNSSWSRDLFSVIGVKVVRCDIDNNRKLLMRLKEFSYIRECVSELDNPDSFSAEQLRSLWTAYCLHWDVVVGSRTYRELLEKLWSIVENKLASWVLFDDEESFFKYMSRLLKG